MLNVGRIRKYNEERVFFFSKKTFSNFEIASLSICEGAKDAGGSWPTCFTWFHRVKFAVVICKGSFYL